MGQGFGTLKNLVLNYLGLSSIDQIYNPLAAVNTADSSDSKNSSMNTNYTKSQEKRQVPSELHKTGKFLNSKNKIVKNKLFSSQ